PSSGVIGDNVAGNVAFSGIEHIGLTGSGATSLAINGTNGNDSINQSGNVVTVNNGADVTFASYPTLTLNGNNGDDTFNVNSATLTGVTTFNVNGGDPTASDRVVVNGTAGIDTITYLPSAADAGSVTGLGPTINLATVENVTINGQGNNDTLVVTTPAGQDHITHTPGVDATQGGVTIRQNNGGPLLPMN